MFKTNYNARSFPKNHEYNEEASKTVPGEFLTVQQLLQKYVQGIAPAISKIPVFTPDASFDDADPTKSPDFDLVDADNLSAELQQKKQFAKVEAERMKKEADNAKSESEAKAKKAEADAKSSEA